MTVAAVGMGLVSPIGLDARQHALFTRAGIGLNPATAFLDARGEPLDVRHCPWLGAELAWEERLFELATAAIESACEPLTAIPRSSVALFFCGPTEAVGSAVPSRLPSRIAERVGCTLAGSVAGTSGFFGAVAAADKLLRSRGVRAAVVSAVDSLIERARLEAFVHAPRPSWFRARPGPSEAAAAIALVAADAPPPGVRPFARIEMTGTAVGSGTDDDDAIVDGAALTSLLAELPDGIRPIVRSYGQTEVDRLRLLEWTYAFARHSERFHARFTKVCPEFHIGSVGAAAGGVNVAFGLAAEMWHAARTTAAGAGPIVCWAIGPEGTRGLCAITPEATP